VTDVRAGNVSDKELKNYPSVNDADGIWRLLSPFRMDLRQYMVRFLYHLEILIFSPKRLDILFLMF
jgi:hypothetical protein